MMSGEAFTDPKKLRDTLAFLLEAATAHAGRRFAGLGVIVSEQQRSLPLYPIGPPLQLGAAADAGTILGGLAIEGGPHHDGFHVLTPTLTLAAVSQYFSPPVVAGLEIDRSRRFGGRYLAALFGSVLPGVLATGIATPALGVIIFRGGQEC